jgi:hypothetical protein
MKQFTFDAGRRCEAAMGRPACSDNAQRCPISSNNVIPSLRGISEFAWDRKFEIPRKLGMTGMVLGADFRSKTP